ncbi:RHS repeat-associated core domain-containing protein, partial [Dokdonella soli]
TLTFGNTRTLTKTYDQDYAISSIASSISGGLMLGLGVDVMGDITRASASLNPATPDRRYAYDPLYRLTTAQTGATPPAPLENYSYDKTGDRLSASLNGGTAQAYTYTAGTHQLASVGGTARSVDPNGNLTAPNTGAFPSFTYDNRNRLSGGTLSQTNPPPCDPDTGCHPTPTLSTVVTYTYDGRGQRVNKTRSDLTDGALFRTTTNLLFGYDEGGRLLGDYAKTGAVQDEYVYLDNVPIAVVAGGSLYAIETDQLGTPRLAFNPATNATVWSWDPLASTFGTNAPTGSLTLNLRFPGQYFDAETGLHYNYKRDYESATGRYTESDPLGLDGGISTYGYASSQPLGKIDPSGMLSFGPTCSATKRIQIAVALIDMGAELLKNACGSSGGSGGGGSCSSGHCMPCEQARKILEWYLTTATIDCNLSFACGLTAPHLSTTNMSLSGSYISTGRPEGCGCLSSTLLHEALHINHEIAGTHSDDDGAEENNTRRETKKCISCARSDFK